MEALYAALPSRNRELWALIRLTEAMAQPDRGNAAVCAQERGALAYQVQGICKDNMGLILKSLAEGIFKSNHKRMGPLYDFCHVNSAGLADQDLRRGASHACSQ